MQCKSEPSPLAQGTLSEHCSHLVRPRFIPACAGNSFATLPSIFERPVHPRLRGELLMKMPSDQPYYGSSPLTRGTPKTYSQESPVLRFIPAYAGNSHKYLRQNQFHSVHPRLRGELAFFFCPKRKSCGSSPLTRGTPHSHRKNTGAHRFIPAYAGNSTSRKSISTFFPVHPRLRGELT